jgi:hypothetical protein
MPEVWRRHFIREGGDDVLTGSQIEQPEDATHVGPRRAPARETGGQRECLCVDWNARIDGEHEKIGNRIAALVSNCAGKDGRLAHGERHRQRLARYKDDGHARSARTRGAVVRREEAPSLCGDGHGSWRQPAHREGAALVGDRRLTQREARAVHADHDAAERARVRLARHDGADDRGRALGDKGARGIARLLRGERGASQEPAAGSDARSRELHHALNGLR